MQKRLNLGLALFVIKSVLVIMKETIDKFLYLDKLLDDMEIVLIFTKKFHEKNFLFVKFFCALIVKKSKLFPCPPGKRPPPLCKKRYSIRFCACPLEP